MAEPAKDKIVPPVNDKIKPVEYDGYKFEFDSDKIDDMEIVEMAAKIESGNVSLLVPFVEAILGADGYTDLKNYFITKEGKLRLTTLMQIFEAIFKQFDPKG